MLIMTEARLATYARDLRIKRPRHRLKTESRKVAEHAAATLLRAWYRLRPEDRKPQKMVLREIEEIYGISRREAFRLLDEVRKHAKLGYRAT